ncbi:coiled-coil domain-containing protein 124 [Salmo salar]|uniref:Coiled-coil domain-containing protein 124-like n=2 Tax=Salmo TaxID=8028 RepID=A0A1S3T4V0_SALSA|nr:coiled-coil domain-containing protein 124-like [Salmo salar]XP_014071621.1 coiled-coil domain-containing protein 124-like [Salmo salar]XP_029562551.1 coiled-coil domain-containing protein 124-like [Salmo trutta]XP_029562552.1 coiled-coil domain-containing protein 124-like [Salmo trutta]XP_029562553.1 coiled-coil domain-containing protein 124-like [Salmo trutta]XP_029562554.1 coiled-coil domain-containing protein 124-like [Salmo trutta]|eukprot:XP_014071620.1 PREDICTED: coiled-coil domain-containing protein 124-like [Salmo salar]
MPKKFQGENSKAVTAKARKAEAKAVEDARKKKELEDALWQENDKHVLKKEQRKDDKEKKRLEALERKKENQRLLDEEAAKIKGKAKEAAAAAAVVAGKVTRAQIEETLRVEQQLQQQEQPKEKEKSHLETPLEENVNRIIPEEGVVEARTIEDAIAMLSTAEELDRHPERRVKAAFAAFEDLNMPLLKKENPNMRLSQLKQQLKKEWMKSPENPLNQRFANYNTK